MAIRRERECVVFEREKSVCACVCGYVLERQRGVGEREGVCVY